MERYNDVWMFHCLPGVRSGLCESCDTGVFSHSWIHVSLTGEQAVENKVELKLEYKQLGMLRSCILC